MRYYSVYYFVLFFGLCFGLRHVTKLYKDDLLWFDLLPTVQCLKACAALLIMGSEFHRICNIISSGILPIESERWFLFMCENLFLGWFWAGVWQYGNFTAHKRARQKILDALSTLDK